MESDRELWEAWCAGDGRRGDRLVRRHLLSIYRFFDTKVPGHAEDLTQKTFLACTRARDRLHDDASFRGFLLGIARIELLRHLEGRGLGRDTSTLATSVVAASDPTPSAALWDGERREALLDAMQQMPLDFQIVVEMHYWEDLPVEEIAAILEVPPGTIKSRLHRARSKLARALEVSAAGTEVVEQAARRLGRRLLDARR